MFTGIIKAMGTISAIDKRGGDARLSIRCEDLPFSSYEVGESIAVNGVCLTAIEFRDNCFDTDVSLETLDVTALSSLSVGDAVNLEPALSFGERLGGHLVSGHVDCIGKVSQCKADARSVRLTIEIAAEFARYVAKKGSVAVDGVSLTVNEVSSHEFEVNIIPHTAQATIIGSYAVGTVVNIEVDLLARYIERLLVKDGEGLSMDFLKANGYV
jgi:riboflavin synthase